MAYDPQDDGFHEIQLSGKQLVFLFMATTVVSIVIFLCGVLVGRGVPRETEASGMAADADPQAAGESGSSGASQGGAVGGTSIPSPAETQPTAEQGLSYPERLADPQPQAEQLKPRAEAKPAVPEEPPAEERAAAERAAEERAAADKPAPEPSDARSSVEADETAASEASEEAPSPSTPATLAESAGEESSKPAATESSAESGSGSWTVQVAALSKRDEAEAVAKRLQSKGYLAFLVGPSGGGATMYRVRVGNYKDRAEAERVMRRLAQEERLKPWITR